MSEISELEGTELYLALCRRRITEWEKADPRSRREHEAAEAFTRAFAELDAALSDGGNFPLDWVRSWVQNLPQHITDGTKLAMAADVLSSLGHEEVSAALRIIRTQQGEEGGIWPVQELLGDHTAILHKDGTEEGGM